MFVNAYIVIWEPWDLPKFLQIFCFFYTAQFCDNKTQHLLFVIFPSLLSFLECHPNSCSVWPRTQLSPVVSLKNSHFLEKWWNDCPPFLTYLSQNILFYFLYAAQIGAKRRHWLILTHTKFWTSVSNIFPPGIFSY